MMSSTLAIIASMTTVVILSGEIFAIPPAQCSPRFLDEVPPQIRKICIALSQFYELSSAMENYIDDKVLRENSLRMDSGVKRQDVDHVFLRFGRRR